MNPSSPHDELRRTSWRIGSVPYLNARPLIYGIEEQVTLCEPARLADLLHRAQFDVGLIPVAEVLLHDQYDIVDGIAVAARGAVASVFLTHRVPLEHITRVAVDPASRSSAWLVRVILKCGFHIEPEFYTRPPGGKLSEHEAMMLIGDEALWYRHRHADTRVGLLDLGEAWWKMTGLPFVFAVWAVQRGVAAMALIELLGAAKTNGLAHLDEIVQNSTEATPAIRREYLTRNVCFDLGAAEKQGLLRFQQYLQEMKLITQCHDLRYCG